MRNGSSPPKQTRNEPARAYVSHSIEAPIIDHPKRPPFGAGAQTGRLGEAAEDKKQKMLEKQQAEERE